MLTETKWVIAASRSQAKIFEHDELTTKLTCISTLSNLDGRQHSREFGQDRLGTRQAVRGHFSSKHTALSGGKDPHEASAQRFAVQLGETLEKSYNEKKFWRAILFAEPHFMGLLKAQISKKVQQHIEWVAKDLAKATTVELEKQINL